MNIEEIKENLCYNDTRNPNITIDKETALEFSKLKIEGRECYCDNCFYGRTKLAEELLRLKINLK